MELRKIPKITTSYEEPPELELKLLPEHLKYTFLQEDSKLPNIINSKLEAQQKEQLLALLRKHEQAIAWKLVDIKGISPSFGTHKINLEANVKYIAQPQVSCI